MIQLQHPTSSISPTPSPTLTNTDEWQTSLPLPLSPVRLPINHQHHHQEEDGMNIPTYPSPPPPNVSTQQVGISTGTGSNIKQPNFLQKLYSFLALDPHPCPEVIYWASDSRQLVIAQPDRLVNEVLPKLFKHGKLSSFGRQLNIYGFSRLFPGRQFKDCHGNISDASVWGHPTLHRLSTALELTTIKRRAAPKLFRTRRLANGQIVRSRAGPGVIAKAIEVREEMAESKRRRGGAGGGIWSSTSTGTEVPIPVPTKTTVGNHHPDPSGRDGVRRKSRSSSISVDPYPLPQEQQQEVSNKVNVNVNFDLNDVVEDTPTTMSMSIPAIYSYSDSAQDQTTPAQVNPPFTPVLTSSTSNSAAMVSVRPPCTSTPTPVLHHPQPNFPQLYSLFANNVNVMTDRHGSEFGSNTLPSAPLSKQGEQQQQSSDTILTDITELSNGPKSTDHVNVNGTLSRSSVSGMNEQLTPLPQWQPSTESSFVPPLNFLKGQVSTSQFQPFNMTTTRKPFKVDTTTSALSMMPPPPLPTSNSGVGIKYHSCPASIQTSPALNHTSIEMMHASSSVPQTPQQWKAFLSRPRPTVEGVSSRPELSIDTTSSPMLGPSHDIFMNSTGKIEYLETSSGPVSSTVGTNTNINMNMNMYSSPIISVMPQPNFRTGDLEAPQDIICQSLTSSTGATVSSSYNTLQSSNTLPDSCIPRVTANDLEPTAPSSDPNGNINISGTIDPKWLSPQGIRFPSPSLSKQLNNFTENNVNTQNSTQRPTPTLNFYYPHDHFHGS